MGMIVERPLSGIKVLEFAQLVAGPSAGQMLADLGAEVTKIEPLEGDKGRTLGQCEAVYKSWNSGKRSIAVDIKSAGGLALTRRLAGQNDIVLESFRPGVLARLGLGYEHLAIDRPGLIYASVAGFSFEGEGRFRRGVDAIVQAESGIMSLTGERGGDPLKVGFQLVDTATGLALGQAILAALLFKERTSKGGHLQVSLYDVALHIQAHQFTEFSISQVVPSRSGNAVAYGYPTDLFHTLDGSLEVAAYFPDHWIALCELLALDGVAGHPKFATNLARIENRDELFELLSKRFITETSAYWVSKLEPRGLMVGRVRDLRSVFEEHRDAPGGPFTQIPLTDDTSGSGDYSTVRLPYVSSSWTTARRTVAPGLGADTAEILESAGYSQSQVESFRRDGVIT